MNPLNNYVECTDLGSKIHSLNKAITIFFGENFVNRVSDGSKLIRQVAQESTDGTGYESIDEDLKIKEHF